MTTARAVEGIEAFTAGELSPRIVGQKRLSFRGIGCRRLFNFGVRPEGSAYFRSGTTFVGQVVDHAVSSRILPFVFNQEQSYVVEVAAGTDRFYRDGKIITNGGGTPITVVNPYSADQLPVLQHVQRDDVLFKTVGGSIVGVQPQELKRFADDNWQLEKFEFVDGPYLNVNTDTARTLTPSVTTGTGTLTATGFTPFVATDVGRLVRLKHTNTWGYCRITAFTSSSVVDMTVEKDFGAATATSEWRFGVFSDTTGWPRTVTFFEQRLFFAGSRDQPQRYDGSASQIFDNFDPDDTGEGGPISRVIGSNQVNPIYWLASVQDLILGTLGGPFRTYGATTDAPLTPDAAETKSQGERGASQVPPVIGDDGVLYFGRNGKTAFELNFDLALNKYRPLDRSVRARHILRPVVVRAAYQQSPFTVAFMVRRDGRLVLLTWVPDEQIFAYQLFEIAGPDDRRGYVEDVAIIPGPDEDEIYLVVRRTSAAGVTRRYIEKLEPQFEDDDVFDGRFLDSGVTYDGTVTTSDLTYSASQAEAATFTTTADVFQASDVGRFIRYRELLQPAEYDRPAVFADAWAEITAFTDPRTVTGRIDVAFPSSQSSVPAGTWGLTTTVVQGPALDALAELTTTFAVTADGLDVGPLEYALQRIELPEPALKVRVGFAYQGLLQPVDLDSALRLQQVRADRTRIAQVVVRFWKTLNAEVGPTADNLSPIEFRDDDSQLDLPPPLFSGDQEVAVNGTSHDHGSILVLQREPLPCEVVGIYPKPMSDVK